MEGGGAHLGLSLTMSGFHRRWSFLCAGDRLHSQVPFSFACVIFVRGGSPWFMGLHLGSWAGIFGAVFVRVHHFHSQGVALVRGRSSSLVLVGDRLLLMGGHAIRVVSWWAFMFICGWSSSWVVVPLVGRSGRELVWCGGGELVGCGGQPLVCGGGGSSWPFVVV